MTLPELIQYSLQDVTGILQQCIFHMFQHQLDHEKVCFNFVSNRGPESVGSQASSPVKFQCMESGGMLGLEVFIMLSEADGVAVSAV